jgi:hypothetical protein
MTSRDELLEAALTYAARGWRVFPLQPGSKRPACPTHTADRCNHTDPFCRHGHAGWEARATTNPDRITHAWSSRPYGIGIACGPSRLLVIDTDLPKPREQHADDGRARTSGEDVLAELVADQPLPDTHTVLTPSGGRHRYYLAPSSQELGNTAGKLGSLIDTRGRGGYVAAPPALVDDTAYRILNDAPCAELPAWLTDRLTQPDSGPPPLSNRPPTPMAAQSGNYLAAALAGETRQVRTAPSGRRNHTLFCAAIALGQLVAADLVDEHTVRGQLLEASVAHIAAGAFSAGEADATITSGLSRGATQPRSRPGRTAA